MAALQGSITLPFLFTSANFWQRKIFHRSLRNFGFKGKSLSRGGGGLPYMGYIGMCGPKGYGLSAVLVINRVSILADFGHFGHK